MFGSDRWPVIIPKSKSGLGLQIFTGIFYTVPVHKNLLVVGCDYIYLLLTGNQESTTESMSQILTGIGIVVSHFKFP